MEKNLFFVLVVICVITYNPAFSQQNKTTKEQQQYFTSYEKSTLAGNDLPVLMPYNRWIAPAGDQVYFGDKELENHALDCAISPDGKWVVVREEAQDGYSTLRLQPVGPGQETLLPGRWKGPEYAFLPDGLHLLFLV